MQKCMKQKLAIKSLLKKVTAVISTHIRKLAQISTEEVDCSLWKGKLISKTIGNTIKKIRQKHPLYLSILNHYILLKRKKNFIVNSLIFSWKIC